MKEICSRREVLSKLGLAVGIGATGGCLSIGPSKSYQLQTYDSISSIEKLAKKYLIDIVENTGGNSIVDFSKEYKRTLRNTLLKNNSVKTVGFQLTYDNDFGTKEIPKPTFIKNDGTYYLVYEKSRQKVTRNWWVFNIRMVDSEPPSSATVITEPPESLPQSDKIMIERLIDYRAAGHDGTPENYRDEPFWAHGARFHNGLDPRTSELIPSPPFDYVKIEGGAATNYYEAKSKKVEVPQTQYNYSLKKVGKSKQAYIQYLKDEYIQARFDDETTSDGTKEILETSINEAFYTESAPPSDNLKTIMDQIGITEYIPEQLSDHEYVKFDILFYFNNMYHTGGLSIKP